ncbi:MAG: lytic murein transglycosylase B [Rhodocyclaceae bacterium]|nr:lytic murein transglycosylase B [Rhodocyclaceae bacterium]
MDRLRAQAAARLRRALALALPLGLALPPAAALPAPAARDFEHRPEVRTFVAEMRDRHGFPEADLRRAFREARFQPSVIRAIMPPRDPGIRSWQAYRARFVEPGRVVMGQRFRRENAAALAGAAARYGVPEEVIVAIIGVETIFGRHTGGYRTFDALATLAFGYPPRAELFRRELEELLLLAREEGRDPRGYKGSYAGALGLPQFLPSSRRRHAVDFDEDGRIDLAASPADAIGSVARFLADHGWRSGEPVLVPATANGDRVAELLALGIEPRLRPAEMADYGVAAPDAPDLPATLVDYVTPAAGTEYRLGFRNFYVLTRYNRSSFYATAVFDLAEALKQ